MQRTLVLVIIALSLTSCAVYKEHHEIVTKRAECHRECQEKLRHCLSVCHNSLRDCSNSSYYHAQLQHKKYKHEQLVQGKDLVLELKSFRDQLQCQKTTCECLEDVRVCRQYCDGRIRKRFQVVPPPC